MRRVSVVRVALTILYCACRWAQQYRIRRLLLQALCFALLAGCASNQIGPARVKQVFSEGSSKLSASVVDGVLHGECKRWHSTGQLAYTGQYLHGKRDGSFSYWNDNGVLLGIEEYHNGTLYSQSTRIPSTIDKDEAQVTKDQNDMLEPWWKTPNTPRTGNFPTLNPLSHRSGVQYGYQPRT